MRVVRSVGLGLAVAAAVGMPGAAARAETRPVVAELFTSEGCSSCPPADALLSELARSRPDVLALAFHVTYWDRLGWPDPFAFEGATQRQRAYAAALRLDSLYTPQLVVDGRIDVVGSERGEVLAALRTAAEKRPEPVALRLARDGGRITLEVGAGGGTRAAAAVLLIGYDPLHRTVVRRGENAGSTLTEANIVRGLAMVGEWRGAALTLHAEPPAGERLAAILQDADGHVLGAARLD
jgi:hypothetical protein